MREGILATAESSPLRSSGSSPPFCEWARTGVVGQVVIAVGGLKDSPLALSMTRSSVSLAVREAFPASNIDRFGQQLGVDWQDAVCWSSEARDKSAGYGRRWQLSSRRCRVPAGASRSRRRPDPGSASASRGRRQLLSCDVDKAKRSRSTFDTRPSGRWRIGYESSSLSCLRWFLAKEISSG